MTSHASKLVSLTNQVIKIVCSDGSFNSIMKNARVINYSDDGLQMQSEMIVEKIHLNPQGTFSGGCMTTMVDLITGLHFMGHKGNLVTFPALSVQLELKFLSPALLGDLVQLDSYILKSGKRLVFMSAQLSNKNKGNKVVAVAQHVLSIDPKASERH